MNVLPLDKQIEIIAALCEGVGQRAVSRLTNTDRKTVARLAFNVGRGCVELHDRMMVGLRVHRIECDELWAYVGHKRCFFPRLPVHRSECDELPFNLRQLQNPRTFIASGSPNSRLVA
jgi:hypothetical protein